MQVRIQTMPKPAPGQLPLYTGTWDCITKTVKNEGFRGLFKGMFSVSDKSYYIPTILYHSYSIET